jgi:hypothetical protein
MFDQHHPAVRLLSRLVLVAVAPRYVRHLARRFPCEVAAKVMGLARSEAKDKRKASRIRDALPTFLKQARPTQLVHRYLLVLKFHTEDQPLVP